MNDTKRVLLVEDDNALRRALKRHLRIEGYEVIEAVDGQEAVDQLAAGLQVDLILSDLQMPRSGGEAVLAAGVRHHTPVIILTANATIEKAVQMMLHGAANFLIKPVDLDMLRDVLGSAFGRRPGGVPTLPMQRSTPPSIPVVIGEDPLFRKVLADLEKVADSNTTVVIYGESGTGKEVMARLIHNSSRRRGGPFIAVNCGAIPDTLLESELFGHKKGAFTDATQSRLGRFQLAEGGTLFLDEIGDTSLAFQVKLLRVLQERCIEILGDAHSRPIDVRVIAATHRDLAAMMVEGTFRQDLFFRLNEIDLRLPPLRERRGDIPLLVDQFIDAANERNDRGVSGVAPEVLAAFDTYPWPGNIRELANVVQRMVVFKGIGQLDISDLPSQLLGPLPAGVATTLPPEGVDLRRAVAGYEESLIDQALSRAEGNRNLAAQLLGLNRTTLVEKLRRLAAARHSGGDPVVID